jgi:hypothetical protein
MRRDHRANETPLHRSGNRRAFYTIEGDNVAILHLRQAARRSPWEDSEWNGCASEREGIGHRNID